MKNTKVLVTGATGFVGSHLTEELVNLGAKITATTHHSIPPNSYFKTRKLDQKTAVVKIELCDYISVQRLIAKVQPQYVFHLAAQPIVDTAYNDPKTTLYSNIMGTINVLESSRLTDNIKGIIVASSDKSYGKLTRQSHSGQAKGCTGRYVPKRVEESPMNSSLYKLEDPSTSLGMTHGIKYKETDPLAGDHPYEVSKSATDLIANSYFKTYGLPVVTTRFGNIYGEGDIHFSRLIPGLMKTIVSKEVFEIRSNGKFVRDYLYVKDVVRGYLLLAKNIGKVKGEAFNFGSDDTYSVLDLIRIISQICQIRIKYKILNIAQNEIPYQSLDYSKIKKTLGWKPEYSLKKTIMNIFLWYKTCFPQT